MDSKIRSTSVVASVLGNLRELPGFNEWVDEVDAQSTAENPEIWSHFLDQAIDDVKYMLASFDDDA